MPVKNQVLQNRITYLNALVNDHIFGVRPCLAEDEPGKTTVPAPAENRGDALCALSLMLARQHLTYKITADPWAFTVIIGIHDAKTESFDTVTASSRYCRYCLIDVGPDEEVCPEALVICTAIERAITEWGIRL